MARLPKPGGDDGVWGTILNAFLRVAHNDDGTLKDDSVSTTTIQNSAVTNVKIANSTISESKLEVTLLNKINSASDPTMGGDLTNTASNAQIVAGAVDTTQLANSSVTEPKLAANNSPSTNDVLTWDGADLAWAASSGGTTNLATTTTANNVTVTSSSGTDATVPSATGTDAGVMSAADKSKLDGVATGATVNQTDAFLLNRSNHTGTQAISTITNLQTTLDGKADESITITGATSVAGGGDLSANRTLSLVNDAANPGNDRYYGTNGAGTKGFHALPSSGASALDDLSDVDTSGVGTGDVLKYDGTNWIADTDNTGSSDPAVGGDLSGTASNAQIVANAVDTTELANDAVTTAKITDANVTAGKLATDSVTTVKITDANVTAAKLATDSVTTIKIVDSNVTTAKIADNNVTDAKIATGVAQSKITNLVSDLAAKVDDSEKGANNGVATLDGSGLVPLSQLPPLARQKLLPYSYTGNLGAQSGAFRLYNDSGSSWTVNSVRASVGTAPTGASVIIDVNINGTTIFTTQGNRPTITASNNTSGTVTNMDVTSVSNGQYLTVDIDQVGSTIPGADLSVQVHVS